MRRRRRGGALLVALAVLAAACGGGGDGGEGDDAVAPGTPAQEVGDPVYGGRVTIPLTSDTPSLDPHKSASWQVHHRLGLVYNKLLTYATGPEFPYSSSVLRGDLAESWETADDGLTYTFHLRDDVTWQERPPVNGRPFVAADVVATFERLRTTGVHAALLENVADFEAPDEHTVVVRMSAPFAPLLNNMASDFMWILPQEAVDGQIDLDTTAIGTGPFTLESHVQNVEVLLKKNPNYFEEGKPYLDEVRLAVIPDQGARTAAFRGGELDLLTSVSPEELEALERTNPDTVISRNLGGHNQLYFDAAKPPFTDVRVRKAMSMAIDRQGMLDSIFGGGGEWNSPVPAQMGKWALPVAEREELMPYDPDRAKELLAEAGYPDGFATSMILTTAYGEQTVRQAQWVTQDLAAIGIEVTIEVLDYATYNGSRWPNTQFEMGFGPNQQMLEPDEWLRSVLHTDGQRNWYNISDPTLDRMLEEQAGILDPDERLEAVHEIQRYALKNVVAPIPTVSPVSPQMWQPWLKNYWPRIMYGYTWLKDAWIDKS
jgi:peptide/nickel transport system substrate-binding protein